MSIPPPVTSGPSYNNYDNYNSRSSDSTAPTGGDNSSPQFQGSMDDWKQNSITLRQTYIQIIQSGGPKAELAKQYLKQVDDMLDQYTGSHYAENDGMYLSGNYSADSTGGGSIIPNSQDPNLGGNPNNQTQISVPISYQDNSHVVTDQGSSVQIAINDQDPDNRTIDAYQKNPTLLIPSNAANVKVTYVDDDAAPGHKMVLVTYTAGGKTQTIKFHKADRADFNFKIQAADPSSVDVTDPALQTAIGTNANVCAVTELGASSDADTVQGTPPDSVDTKANTRTWNKNDSVDYYVTEGKETDKIYTDNLNITLPDRSDTAYVTKTGPHSYTIEIKDANGKTIRKIEASQVDHLNFSGVDGDNLFFQDKSASPPPAGDSFKAWSAADCAADTQLTLNGDSHATKGAAGAGQSVNPNKPEDTPADKVENGIATYNNSDLKDVSIHTYYDDPPTVKEHDIFTTGTFTVYAASYQDKVDISKETTGAHAGQYKLVFTDGTHTVTYYVTGDISKIKIKGVLPLMSPTTPPKRSLALEK
ncbi:MAG: hypothetical protein U1F57_02375 [bacterium]